MTGIVALANGGLGVDASSTTAHFFFGNRTGSAGAPSFGLIGTADTSPNWYGGTTTGAVNVLALTPSPAPAALVIGLEVRFKPNLANTTTTPTLNVNSLGAKTIVKNGSAPLDAGDLWPDMIAVAIYDGTNWQLQNTSTVSTTLLLFQPANFTGTTCTAVNGGSHTGCSVTATSTTPKTSGSGNYTVPAGVNYITVEAVGGSGGGGGSGGDNTGSTSTASGGGGGGGAGEYVGTFLAVSPADTVTIAYGTAGTAGVAGTTTGAGGTGGTGGNTTVTYNSVVYVTAHGGVGGSGSAPSATNQTGGALGTGGTGSTDLQHVDGNDGTAGGNGSGGGGNTPGTSGPGGSGPHVTGSATNIGGAGAVGKAGGSSSTPLAGNAGSAGVAGRVAVSVK